MTDRLNAAADLLLPEVGATGQHTADIARHLRRHLEDDVTDLFLELLVSAMSVAFQFSRDYRRNLAGYEATLEFCAARRDASGPDVVRTIVEFEGEHMHVNPSHPVRVDTLVRFSSPDALRRFLLSKDQDIIATLLEGEVDVKGNLNHVYKFGFLAADLLERLP